MDIREPHVQPAEAHRELRVIHANQVQHGGVQIVDVDFALDGLVSKLVGRPESYPALNSCPGQPEREAERIVVTPRALGEGRPAELPRPYQERFLEKPAGLQVLIKAAIGWSTAREFLAWPSLMLPCWSQRSPDPPGQVSSTNRTPRSIKRRASRHSRPKTVVWRNLLLRP